MAQVNVDLMIGDLVIDAEFEERPRVDVVECIEPNRVMLRNGKLYTPIEFIKPVPLTAEILEKNGFNYLNITDVWIWREGSSLPIHLDNYNEDGWRLLINCDNIPCECKFVNQLQHALRLCGIEKEIMV